MSNPGVVIERDGRVASLVISRPEVKNAMTPEADDYLHERLDELGRDDDISVIILTGVGDSFSTGFDLKKYGKDAGVDQADPRGKSIEEYLGFYYRYDTETYDKMLHLMEFPKPIIAAVNGPAMGRYFWYQLACDVTIASEKALFSQPEVRMVSTTSFLFAALCGWKVANRYTLTGDCFDAQEAFRIGMVNEVVPHSQIHERAQELAQRMALVPLTSLSMNKAITMKGLLASGMRSGMEVNSYLSMILHASYGPDRQRLFDAQASGGMRAFLAERDDKFYPEPFGPRSLADATTKKHERTGETR